MITRHLSPDANWAFVKGLAIIRKKAERRKKESDRQEQLRKNIKERGM